MFRPGTGTIVRDDILEEDVDWSFADPDKQGVVESAIRLLSTTAALRQNERGWVNVPWSERDELEDYPGAIDAGWVSAPGEPETRLGFLKIRTDAGEQQTLANRNWAGDSTGWTLQTRLMVVEEPTSDFGELAGHSIVVDDGAHREVVWLHSDHVYLEKAGVSFDVDLSRMRQIRIAGEGEDLTVFFDDGRICELTGEFTGESLGRQLLLGSPEPATGDYETHWDYVYQYWEGGWADVRDDVQKAFATTPQVATSPTYAPAALVKSWTRVVVETTGEAGGGTTSLGVQWRDGDGNWTTLSTTNLGVGYNTIDLTALPVRGDGTDAIRFLVTQVSTSGTAEPLAVDSIVVETEFLSGQLIVRPTWGPSAGGQSVLVEIGQDASRIGQQPLSTNSTEAEPGDAFTDRIALIPCNGDLNDDIGAGVATPTGDVAYRTGLFAQAAVLGTLLDLAGSFNNSLASFGDSVYGRVGIGVTPIVAVGLALIESSISAKGLSDDPFQSPMPAQGAVSPVGGGFTMEGVGSVAVDGNCFGFALQILKGSITVTHGTHVHTFYAHDYKSPRWVTIKADTVDQDLEFTALESSEWLVGSPRLFDTTAGSALVPIAHQVGTTGFGAEARAVVYFFSDEDLSLLSTISGNSGWEIGIRASGLLYAAAGDGSSIQTVEAAWPVVCGARFHVALSFRIFSDHKRLQLLVNGEVCGEAVSTLSTVATGTDLSIGSPLLMQIEEIAVQDEAFDARALAVRRGLAAPLFEVDTDTPISSQDVLVLRFDEETGPIKDSSQYKNHCYVPVAGRPGIYRSVPVESRSKIALWSTGLIKCTHNPSLLLTVPVSLYARGRFWAWTGVTQTLFKKANLAGTRYLIVEILEDGRVRVRVNSSGSESSLTSVVSIADQKVRSLGVEVSSTSISIMIDSVVATGAATVGALSALDQNVEIGTLCTMHLSDFVLRLGAFDPDTFDQWRDRSLVKRTITTDKIFVDGTQVDATKIRHTHPRRKYFVAPAHEAGDVSVYAIAEAASPGLAISADRPYSYLLSYLRTIDPLTFGQVLVDDSDGNPVPIDTEDSAATATKSPFRIVKTVPPDGVGLAYVQAPPISAERLVGVTPLEHETAENLSTYFGGEFATSGPSAVAGGVKYAAQVDTRDILVSNRAVILRDFAAPAALYYKYLIGRGRYYVYNPNATDASGIALIRESISLIDNTGKVIALADFPWDIEVSTVDVHGDALPANVFSVVFFSKRLYIPGKTIWIRYPARDSANSWAFSLGRSEVLNPVPVLQRVDGALGRDTFAVDLTPSGVYDLRVGT